MTPDPAGHLDSCNPYQFVFNNPYRYHDPRGEFAFVIPLAMFSFEAIAAAFAALTTTELLIAGGVATTGIFLYNNPDSVPDSFVPGLGMFGMWSQSQKRDRSYTVPYREGSSTSYPISGDELFLRVLNSDERQKGEWKFGDIANDPNYQTLKGGPRRDPKAGDAYVADPAAEGSSHTTIGVRTGRRSGNYLQGATFDENGEFQGRTDVSDHGRPKDHPHVPHWHPAKSPNGTGPASPTPLR